MHVPPRLAIGYSALVLAADTTHIPAVLSRTAPPSGNPTTKVQAPHLPLALKLIHPELDGSPTQPACPQACYGRSGRQRSAAQLYGDVGSVLLVRGQAEVAAELMEHVAALAQAEGWWVAGGGSVWNREDGTGTGMGW